jgi:hypothetical protein
MTNGSESKSAQAFECRAATVNDETDILAVLKEVASEIPVKLESSDAEAIIQSIIAKCCESGESKVAINAADEVVGFALAKPDQLERFLHKNYALTLPYIGVSKTWQGLGILSALMAQFVKKGVPLTASVLNNNQSSMADRLAKIGFKKTETKGNETKFRWAPTPIETGASA